MGVTTLFSFSKIMLHTGKLGWNRPKEAQKYSIEEIKGHNTSQGY